MNDHEKECRDCGIYFRNLQDLRDWRLIQTGICENCHKKEERKYMESKQRNDETKNQSITTGDVWKHKIEVNYYVRVSMVSNGEVFYVTEDGGRKRVDDVDQFLAFYSLHKSAEPTIAVDSVWRCKEDGELVYIEHDDGTLCWNLNFSPLGETDMYADDTEGFLSKYEFVCDSKYDSSLAFIGKGEENQDTTSKKGTSLLGDAINPSHYQSDPSGVQCIEISENWSFCLGNALKYMWRSGKKDSSKNIEDLQKAIWYIEREISRLDKGGV